MDNFDWTYDIKVHPLHVGCRFRIDNNSCFTSHEIKNDWAEDKFIEFEITHVDYINVEIRITDFSERPDGRWHRVISKEDVLKLVREGYWQQL